MRTWDEICDSFGFQSLGDLVVKLQLREENIAGGPRLGEGQACTFIKDQQSSISRTEDDHGIEAIRVLELGVGSEA